MQYPELNIGEFAGKHSAKVELEKHEDEEGYLLMVDVRPKGGEEGYPLSIGARPETVEEVGELYENQFSDLPSDELVTVYGSDETAIQSMKGSDVWARFEAPDEKSVRDSYEFKGWAVDIEPLIRDMEEDQYQEVIDEISASTLYVVNRAESEGEVGIGLEEFHRDIVRELRTGVEPVRIDVVEESESTEEYVEIDEDSSDSTEELLDDTGSRSEINYDEIVSGTISQAKTQIEEVEDELEQEDWKALLEAEKEGKNRTTFKPYLEENLEKERSEDTSER